MKKLVSIFKTSAVVAMTTVAMLTISCNKTEQQQQSSDSGEILYIQGSKVPEDMSPDSLGNSFLADYLPQCLNSVAGHDEKDTIWGKFFGRSIDTLHVEARKVQTDDTTSNMEYYVVSSRKGIPEVKLHAAAHRKPKLVFEGDLDGNGTDEWGYLNTGVSSQWRTYRVFTWHNKQWRYLVKSDRFETTEWFRCSGNEIVEKGNKKGYVKINYGIGTIDDGRVLDTVVRATFTKIKD